MYRPPVIFCLCALWLVVGHCNTLILQPYNYVPDPGNSYAWIIPPQNLQEPAQTASTHDIQNQSPPPRLNGCGHPPFNRRHSHGQLGLPNEFLMTPSDPQRPSPPVFLQLDPVNCDGATTNRPNEDCTQQRPTARHQSNLAPVHAMPDQRSAVSWPSSHGGGVGLLFFVPESASHLPVEQLIRQHMALHRAQLPFDISSNCGDTSPGCLGMSAKPPTTATTFNGELVENVNYASLPLVKNVNSSSQRRRGWRTIGELLAQQQQQQHQRELSMLPL